MAPEEVSWHRLWHLGPASSAFAILIQPLAMMGSPAGLTLPRPRRHTVQTREYFPKNRTHSPLGDIPNI